MFSKVFLLSFALTASSSFSTQILLAGDDTDVVFPSQRLTPPMVREQIEYRKSQGSMGQVAAPIEESNIRFWFPAAAQVSEQGLRSFLESHQGVIVAEYFLMFQILQSADAEILQRYYGVDPQTLATFRSVFRPLNDRVESFLIANGFGQSAKSSRNDEGPAPRSLPSSSASSSSSVTIESVQARAKMYKHRGQLDRVVDLKNLERWVPLLSQVSSEGLGGLLEDHDEADVAILAEYWLMHEILAQCDPDILPYYGVDASTLSTFNSVFESLQSDIESALIEEGFGTGEKREVSVASTSPASSSPSRESGFTAIKVFEGGRKVDIERAGMVESVKIDESVTAYGYNNVPYPVITVPSPKFRDKARVFVVDALPELHTALVLPCYQKILSQVQAGVDARLTQVGVNDSELDRVLLNGGFLIRNMGKTDLAYFTLSDDGVAEKSTQILHENIQLFLTIAFENNYRSVVLQLDDSQIATTLLQAALLNAIRPWMQSFHYIGLQFPKESLGREPMTSFKRSLDVVSRLQSDAGA